MSVPETAHSGSLLIVTLPGHGLSVSAAARGKKWIRVITGVDSAKRDGRAFLTDPGAWHSFGRTVEVSDGAWVLAYVEHVTASGRLRDITTRLYQALPPGRATLVRDWDLGPDRGWALRIRDEVAGIVGGPAAQPIAQG